MEIPMAAASVMLGKGCNVPKSSCAAATAHFGRVKASAAASA